MNTSNTESLDPSQEATRRIVSELAKELGLPFGEVFNRFCNSFAPDPELEAALERLQQRGEL